MIALFRYAVLVAILTAVVLFVSVSTVFAQSSEGVEIKPAVIEDRAEPGEVFNFSVQVTNISGGEKTFYLSAQDITGLDDSGLPIFSEETEITPYELSSWIQLPDSQIVLGPGQSRSVPFSIRVPENASPGGHFGGVFLDVRPPKQRTTGAAVGMKVGTIINLRIAGETEESAQLQEFSTSKIIYGAALVDFNARVANLGNVLIRPYGLIEVTDMRGSKVAVVTVNETNAAVFPKADKALTTRWEYDGVAFGRYNAVVSLAYGEDGRKTISAATSFWVLPLKPILTVLGTIFAILLVFYVLVRSYIARKIREMSGGRGGGDLYARRNQSAVPRLLIIALALLFLAIAFLILLFLMFA